MENQLPIHIPEAPVAEICRKYYVNRLSLFGSILTPHFRPDSNVNFLVEFGTDHIPDYFTLLQMQYELGEIIQREADLRTLAEIPAYDRERLLGTVYPLYSA